jgi:uncharacterized membrane protein
MNRWVTTLGIALFFSVGLNFALAGFLAGRRLAPPLPPHADIDKRGAENGGDARGKRPPALGSDQILAAIPDEVRRLVRRDLGPRVQPAMRERLLGLRDARLDALEAIRARPFDAEAAQAALLRQRQEMDAMQAILHAALLKRMQEAHAAGSLPPPPEPKPRGRVGDRLRERDGAALPSGALPPADAQDREGAAPVLPAEAGKP